MQEGCTIPASPSECLGLAWCVRMRHKHPCEHSIYKCTRDCAIPGTLWCALCALPLDVNVYVMFIYVKLHICTITYSYIYRQAPPIWGSEAGYKAYFVTLLAGLEVRLQVSTLGAHLCLCCEVSVT